MTKTEKELEAIKHITAVLTDYDVGQCRRILGYLQDRFIYSPEERMRRSWPANVAEGMPSAPEPSL